MQVLNEEGWDLPATCTSPMDIMTVVTEAMCKKLEIDGVTINYGYCFIWAWLCALYSPEIKLVSTEDHACIAFEDVIWDSYSTLDPEFNPGLLVQNRAQFGAYWGTHGTYRHNWLRMMVAMIPRSEKQEWDDLCSEERVSPAGQPWEIYNYRFLYPDSQHATTQHVN